MKNLSHSSLTQSGARLLTRSLAIAGLSSFFLLGCSTLGSLGSLNGMLSASGDKAKKPAELVKLQQPQTLLQQVFSTDIGSSRTAKKDPLALRAVFDNQDGQTVFAASRDGKVTAISMTGKQRWSIDVNDDITGGLAYDAVSQTLILSTREGLVVALDSYTGQVKWQRQLSGTVLTAAAISANKNRVLLSANDGFLYGLDLQNGLVVWQFATQVPKISVRGTATPTIASDNASNALFATADGRIYAMDIVTGSPTWSNKVGVSTGVSDIGRMKDVDSSPVIKDNYLYSTSYSGQLLGINLTTRKVAFFKQVASLHQPLVTDNLVVVSGLDGMVYAYDKQTGALQWQNQELGYRELTNPVEVAQYVAVGDLDGVVHLLDKSTGQIVSRANGKGALNYLQVVGNKLITQSNSGNVAIWQW